MGETVIVTCLPGISSAPVVSLVPMVSKASVPFSGVAKVTAYGIFSYSTSTVAG
ncbi:MAG: hypothetical protein ACLUHO_17895 [Parabacteroides distasonis]|uniref:hypothetical protein n=1 Tax=Parabacteroides distasonis TaxID=823 RepID=UPI0012E75D70